MAELAGSPALVALSPSVLSLRPVSLPAQSGSDPQLLPLAEGCGHAQSQWPQFLPSWSSPTFGARKREMGVGGRQGQQSREREGVAAKSPPGFSLMLSVVWKSGF